MAYMTKLKIDQYVVVQALDFRGPPYSASVILLLSVDRLLRGQCPIHA